MPSRRKSPQQKYDWGHPEGIPLEELDEKAVLSGVVVVTRPEFGVFVDVGAERDALLGCPARLWRKFWPGDLLDNLTIGKVDLESRKFVVKCAEPETELEKNRKPLDKLKPGTTVEGIIEGKNRFGIFVNIRAANTGRLNVPRSIGAHFFKGMILKKVRIESVDVDLQHIGLSLDDPDATLADMSMVCWKRSKVKAKAKTAAPRQRERSAAGEPREPRARSREPAKARTKAASPAPIEDVGVVRGEFLDGTVTGIGKTGVIVDCEIGKPCTLEVPDELKKKFLINDRVQGMMVERITPSGGVFLFMEDPELEFDEVPVVKPLPKRKAKPKARRG